MDGSVSQKKISLKILVDVKSNKVVFAEADKEFVDFIFGIMSLPLSTVTKLLNEKAAGMVGCLGAVYKSIESLGAQYYEPKLNKDSVLKPKFSVIVPLLSLVDTPDKVRFYKCRGCYSRYSDCRGMSCSSCNSMSVTEELTYNLINPRLACYSNPGFVKGAASYMVMDNLDVKPMSISLIRSLVNDFDTVEEKQVEFGLEEGVALLKASLEKQAVLTSVFLQSRKEAER